MTIVAQRISIMTIKIDEKSRQSFLSKLPATCQVLDCACEERAAAFSLPPHNQNC
jgi:hypothetical protein